GPDLPVRRAGAGRRAGRGARAARERRRGVVRRSGGRAGDPRPGGVRPAGGAGARRRRRRALAVGPHARVRDPQRGVPHIAGIDPLADPRGARWEARLRLPVLIAAWAAIPTVALYFSKLGSW